MKPSVRAVLVMLVGMASAPVACVRNGQVGPALGDQTGGAGGADAARPAPSADVRSDRGAGGSGGAIVNAPAPSDAADVPSFDDVARLDLAAPPPMADAAPATDARAEVAPPPPPNPMAGPAGPWARGIRVRLVEVTQGVFINIGEGSNVIAPAMRNAPIIEGRPLYVRVHVATEAPFAARPLRAVLSLEYTDQSKFEIEDAKTIAATSNPDRLETTFNLLVPAASVKAGATLVASVYEMGQGIGAEPMTPPRFPAAGRADLAIKAGRMELWVVGAMSGTLTDTPERRKKLENDLYDLYPVQKVNFRMRAPLVIEGDFSSSKAFAALRAAREADNAKPYEYYHLFTAATGVSFSGVGQLPGATATDGARRNAVTIVRSAIDGNTNTTAHELGHNHGRPHAPGCNAAGPDAMYPYRMTPGDMGGNGFSLITMTLKTRAMFRELMSYCRPRWISDYQWGKLEARVRAVSAFAADDNSMTQMLASRSLQGFAGPGETPNWGIVAGTLVDAASAISSFRYARLHLANGKQITVAVAVSDLSDDKTREFAVNLSGDSFGESEIVEAEIFVDGARWVVPVAGMDRLR